MLPRLFFENFSDTTFMVTTTAAVCDPEKSTTQPAHQEQPTATTTDQGGGREIIVGFLCGLVSQAKVGEVSRVSIYVCTFWIYEINKQFFLRM